MPLIDLHCHLGATPETRALQTPEMSALKAYADHLKLELYCVSSSLAGFDIEGGAQFLNSQVGGDARARGWLSLSIHKPEQSIEVARQFLVKSSFCGTLVENHGADDVLTTQGGRELLNALRRYFKPVLLSVSSPPTLLAAIEVANEFKTLKFLISPQTEHLTRITPAAMKESINAYFLPVAAFTERDLIASALQTLGERRVVWASHWGRFHPAAALGMVRDSALSAPQRERVSLKNAREMIS